MLLYRLALQRIIEYLKLDQLFKEDEQRLKLLQKKSKPVYKTALKTDQTLNFYLSVLLSIIGMLVCMSIPFAALETPCEIFFTNETKSIHDVATWIEKNLAIFDLLVLLFSICVVLVSAKTVVDAIKNTNISISPWIERGRYTLPPHMIRRRRQKPDLF